MNAEPQTFYDLVNMIKLDGTPTKAVCQQPGGLLEVSFGKETLVHYDTRRFPEKHWMLDPVFRRQWPRCRRLFDVKETT